MFMFYTAVGIESSAEYLFLPEVPEGWSIMDHEHSQRRTLLYYIRVREPELWAWEQLKKARAGPGAVKPISRELELVNAPKNGSPEPGAGAVKPF